MLHKNFLNYLLLIVVHLHRSTFWSNFIIHHFRTGKLIFKFYLHFVWRNLNNFNNYKYNYKYYTHEEIR